MRRSGNRGFLVNDQIPDALGAGPDSDNIDIDGIDHDGLRSDDTISDEELLG